MDSTDKRKILPSQELSIHYLYKDKENINVFKYFLKYIEMVLDCKYKKGKSKDILRKTWNPNYGSL